MTGYSYILVLFCLVACQVNEVTEKGRILARVHESQLHESDLAGLFPTDVTSEDSALLVNAYIERWVRDAVMLHEAEQSMPSDINIESLVEDYRASLLRDNYERIVLETSLDSTITDEEISSFYSADETLFALNTGVVRCYYIKLAESSQMAERIKAVWKDDVQSRTLLEIVADSPAQYLLDDSTWYSWNHILSWLPDDMQNESQLKIGKTWSISSEGQTYFLLVFEKIDEGEAAPLEYVRDQIEKLILHKRKMQTIELKKEDLLKRELRNNNVKIYNR